VEVLIVPFLTALPLIAALAGPSPWSPTQPAAQPVTPTAPAAAPFKVVTELDKCIWHIFQDSKGTYWFGSHGQGLYRWEGVGNTFAHFTTDSDLIDNDIGKIQEDKFGNLYINTSNGISKFDGRTFTTMKVDDSDPNPISTELKLGPDVLWFKCGGEKPTRSTTTASPCGHSRFQRPRRGTPITPSTRVRSTRT
jgi:hypothetical protein